MLLISFIFRPGTDHDEFHRLDDATQAVAFGTEGFLGSEAWWSDDATGGLALEHHGSKRSRHGAVGAATRIGRLLGASVFVVACAAGATSPSGGAPSNRSSATPRPSGRGDPCPGTVGFAPAARRRFGRPWPLRDPADGRSVGG